MKKILIAGIGNIFFGDDAFGCEVLKLLQKEDLPDNIKLIDFGIKTRDLAYELCENYNVVILIDAVKFDKPSGTISLIEINENDFVGTNTTLSHVSNLEESLIYAKSLGAEFQKIYLVGCEPESLEILSETVKESILKSVGVVKKLIEV